MSRIPLVLLLALSVATELPAAHFALRAPAFDASHSIPPRHTCDGAGVSPALDWEGVPDRARSLALIALVPDLRPGERVLWVVYDLPPDLRGLREDAHREGLPRGAREGENDWGERGWRAPCPTGGELRVAFRLYALDVRLDLREAPTQPELEAAMSDHIVARADLTATAVPARAPAPAPGRGFRMSLHSPAFESQTPIPERYTCDGRGISPPLDWQDLPQGTRSLALVVMARDAPVGSRIHWVLYDLPPQAGGLPRDAHHRGLPAGAREGENDWGEVGWRAPCPESRDRERFQFRLYALDVALGDLGTPTQPELEAAMSDHILGRSDLVAYAEPRYRRR